MTPQEVVETKDKDFHEATKTWEITWSEEMLSEHDHEYVRKDSFIDKMIEFLGERYLIKTKEPLRWVSITKVINDFKNYIEK